MKATVDGFDKDRQPHSKREYERHRFSPDLVKRLQPFYKVDNWHGLVEVLEDWGIVSGSIFISLWIWRNCDISLGILGYLISLIIIGSRQHAIADLLHQASHRTLAKNQRLNYILGTFCSGYLVFQSFTGYQGSHIYKHHPHLGNKDLDPDYKGLVENNLYGSGLNSKQVIRYLQTLYYPTNTLMYLKYLAQYKMFNNDEKAIESLIRLTYLSALITLSVWLNFWHLVIFYWFIPLITTASWTGSFVELAEHYPLMETAPKVDIYLTRNRICNPFINFFVGKHWDGYHLVHHLFPKIPSWNYEKSHQILMEDPFYLSVNQDTGFSSVLRGMISSSATSNDCVIIDTES